MQINIDVLRQVVCS